MAESIFAQAMPPDLTEIPAYVVRPPQARGHRYQAPRLSRTTLSLKELRDLRRRSWSQRLVDGWRRQSSGLELAGAEPVSELRYQARQSRYPVAPSAAPVARVLRSRAWPVATRLVGRASLAAVMLAAFGGVGWAFGSHIPAVAPTSSQVPASRLIASQNFPSKLPLIEHRASTGGLEQGRRSAVVIYIVQPGDSFKSVGKKFGLTPRTVRLTNQMPLGQRLKAGQKIAITPQDGATHPVQAGETLKELSLRYQVAMTRLLAANAGVKPDGLTPGQTVFVPGATSLKLAQPAMRMGGAGFRGLREGSAGQRLTASRSLIGQFGNRVGALSWPAAGDLSSPFGVRGYSFHPGMDVCNAVGTPIHAAKAGVVRSSGWAGAYGYAVDIDHGGGVVTRYGHCSRLMVTAGQSVDAGQQIAKMGSTGRSTGPHVHFEVRIQGRAVNPATFF